MTTSSYLPSPTHLFEMHGRDARDFLHRLTTANIRDLEPGQLATGFFLNPQGKVRAAFRVAARAPDSFYLEVEGGTDSQWRAALLSVMDQYTFAEKYELREISGPEGFVNAWLFGHEGTENTFRESGEGPARILHFQGPRQIYDDSWTSVWARPDDLRRVIAENGGPRLDEATFERQRVLALCPRIDHELVFDANPLELGLRAAIADNKGCYPGQEVIEKIISLGSPAKRLALLTGTGPVPGPKSPVYFESGEVGRLTSVVHTGNDGFATLALLRKNAAAEGKILRAGSPDDGVEMTVERLAQYE